jgi:hypothetical protein
MGFIAIPQDEAELSGTGAAFGKSHCREDAIELHLSWPTGEWATQVVRLV